MEIIVMVEPNEVIIDILVRINKDGVDFAYNGSVNEKKEFIRKASPGATFFLVPYDEEIIGHLIEEGKRGMVVSDSLKERFFARAKGMRACSVEGLEKAFQLFIETV